MSMDIPAPGQGLTVQEVDGETVILNRQTNEVHTLNPTASFIWRRIEQGETPERILQALVDQYAIDTETADADLKQIISQFQALGLLDCSS